MPISRNHRRKLGKKKTKPKPSSKLRYSRYGLKEGGQADFRKAVLEAVKKSVADFPATLKALNDELRESDPIGILATLAFYGLQTTVTQHEGVDVGGLVKEISQHHVEFLQALVLTIPIKRLSHKPFTPDVIQRVIELLPKVTETSFHQRILASEAVQDKVEVTLRSLQERIRLHTQAVRNWGYFSEVVGISTELFAPLDSQFKSRLGFGASDLIHIMKSIVGEFERRINKHRNTLAKVLKEPTAGRIVKAYYDNVPELVGSPDELLRALPLGITREGMMGVVMGHFDLRLSDLATFTPDDVAMFTGVDAKLVEAALRAVSLPPGSLENAKAELLFLGNPIWDSPGVDLGNAFFLPIPQMFFSHVHRIMERLAEKAGIKVELESRRSEYLENQLLKALEKGLPGGKFLPSAKWKFENEQFETDLVVIIDRTVLIAEAKSNRLTASGLRGAPDRVKRHVEDMVIYPSVQSARLESLIVAARDGNVDADNVTRKLGIDPAIVDHIIRISVTLDDFSILSSAEADFKEIGWVPTNHKLAPTILIADLLCIVDILDNPLLLLHYLSERIHLQKSFDLLGDELDFLGLYLETGFNIAGLREENTTFSPSSMSVKLDRYYMAKDAGVALNKPKAKLQPLFAQTIKKLDDRRSLGWTTAGLNLLSVADPDEQKIIESRLANLRRMVRKTYSDPAHLSSLQVKPPEERKALVVFYLFPEQLRDSSKATMEQIAVQALDKSDKTQTVVVFGRSTELWEEPYEAVLVVALRKSQQKGSA